MDASQITGATSSYARKYALNGLFCIDDNKDADSADNSKEQKQEYKCEKCGKKFEPWTDKNGKTWSPGQVAHFSKNKNNGVALCYECSKSK
jgi:DNA-directed RNA polymerase subunit RPC12/RpoP